MLNKYSFSVSLTAFSLLILLVTCYPRIENKRSTKMPKKDRIDHAMSQEFLMTVDPNLNTIPRDRLLSANSTFKNRSSQSKSSTASLAWEERGPNNVAGRVRALLFDLNDRTYNTVWAAGVSGGLWKTTSINDTDPKWQKQDDFFSSLSICALAQDPKHPEVMYFGTGEGFFEVDASPGMGIWKSTDAGESWTHLTTTSKFKYIQSIKHTDNGQLLISTHQGLHKSSDGGINWTKVLGVNKFATVDEANDIEINGAGDIFVTMGLFSSDGIYKSSDNGSTWKKLTTGLPFSDFQRIEIATAPNDPNRIYALFQDESDKSCKGIYRSNNGGTSWYRIVNPKGHGMNNFARTQAWYNLSIAVDPNNKNRVFIGGIDLHVTGNGGYSWNQISHWSGGAGKQYVHADQHAIVFAPNDSQKVLFGNDGGVWISTDAKSSTPDVFSRNKGLNVTQFYACTAHPEEGRNYFIAGSQDNGTQLFTDEGLNSTREISGGDGARCYIDEDNPQIQITSYVFNNYFVSTDGGANFDFIQINNDGLFANASVYDSKINKLYASSKPGKLLRWEFPSLKNDIANEVTINGLGNQQISYICMSPTQSNALYLGTAQGDIFYVTNVHYGTSKSAIKLRDAQYGFVSSIVVNPANKNHLLISYSNYGITSIFETKNNGTTWTSIEGDLPDFPVRQIVLDQADSDRAYIATELGVWLTHDINGSQTKWIPSNAGLANVRVDMIHRRASDGLFLAASHGRGLFSSSGLIENDEIEAFFESETSSAYESYSASTAGSCDEGATNYSLSVKLSGASTTPVNVQVNVDHSQSTAVEGRDFLITNKNIRFESGNSLKQEISVTILDDGSIDPNEEIVLKLSSADVDITQGQHTIKIYDNDENPIQEGNTHTHAQAQLGNGNSVSFNYPFGGFYEDERTQILYYADELLEEGLSKGAITELELNIKTKISDAPFENMCVKMKHTSATQLDNKGNQFEGGSQVVFDADFVTDKGWNLIEFEKPFEWNGRDNILLEFCFNNNDWSDDDGVYCTITNKPTVQYKLADSNIGCLLSTVGEVSNLRPNIKFSQNNTGQNIDIQSNVGQNSVFVGAREKVYFYEDGKIIATLENLENVPLGCVSIDIDKAGNGYYRPNWTNGKNISRKNFFVDVSKNLEYALTLFLTNNELGNWTDQSLHILHTPGESIKSYAYDGYLTGITSDQYSFSNGTAVTANFKGYGGFALTDSPVNQTRPTTKLVSQHMMNGNMLRWNTDNMDAVDGYVLQKSYDGTTFDDFMQTMMHDELSNEEAMDYEIMAGDRMYYYRVKTMLNDGSYIYSNVASVFVEDYMGATLIAYPNPFSEEIQLDRIGEADIVNLKVYDSSGKIVISLRDLAGDNRYMKIDMSNFADGIYYIKYNTSLGFTSTLKIVKG